MTISIPDPKSLRSALLALENALSGFERTRSEQRFTAQSADGEVAVTVDGMMRAVTISIGRSQLQLGGVALAEKVRAVVNDAITQADDSARTASAAFAASLGLPALPNYGAPPPDFPDFESATGLIEIAAMTQSPCDSGTTFECRRGSVVAVLNAKRRVVSLSFDEPLPTLAEHLAARIRDAINCADGSASTPEEDPNIPIVTGTPSLGNSVLYANGALKLCDRVRVLTGDGTAWGAVINAGPDETNIGVEADVGDIDSRGRVFVRDRGRVHGHIRTASVVETQNQTQIDGPIEQHLQLVLPHLEFHVPFPTTSDGTIELEPGQQQVAPPGYYRQLHPKSGAQVYFSAGTYYLDDFFLEPGSRLWLDHAAGPIVIWVRNGLVHRGEILTNDAAFPRLLIGVLGQADVLIERVYRGTIAAPSAKINLGSVTEIYEGAFHGKSIEAFPDATIHHHPFELPYSQLPGLGPPEPEPEPLPMESILSFESLVYWTSPQATLALATTPKTHLQVSLHVPTVSGWTQIISAPLSSQPLSAPTGKVYIDLWVSSRQPNPWWHGQFSVRFDIPSANIIDAGTNQIELTPLQKDRFVSLELVLPQNVRTAIAGEHSDVVIKLIINAAAGAGPYYLDHLRFA